MSFWNYFPLKIGNFWIYKINEKFDNDYTLVKVTITEKIPFNDKVIYIFSHHIDEEEVKRESYVIQNDGIYLYARKVEDNLIVFDPMIPFLPYNFLDIEWWNWEGKAGFVNTKILYKNNKMIEDNVIKITYTEENKFGKSNYILYLKKNVGIIKEEGETPFAGYISEVQDYEVSFDDFSFIDFKTYQDEIIQENEEIIFNKNELQDIDIYDQESIDIQEMEDIENNEDLENLFNSDINEDDINEDDFFEEGGNDINENRW